MVAVVIWSVNLYGWHTPFLYQAALRHDGVHVARARHVPRLLHGRVVGPARAAQAGRFQGACAQLGYIFVVRLIGTVLANVFLWSGHLFYPFYLPGTAKWGIAPLADQSTAGAVMMIEESLLTIGLFCWLFFKMARQAEERESLLDYARAHDIELTEERAGRAVRAGRGADLRARMERTAAAT